jgi:hypothetical protein
VGRSLRFRLGEVEKYIERQEVLPGETTEAHGEEDENAA